MAGPVVSPNRNRSQSGGSISLDGVRVQSLLLEAPLNAEPTVEFLEAAERCAANAGFPHAIARQDYLRAFLHRYEFTGNGSGNLELKSAA